MSADNTPRPQANLWAQATGLDEENDYPVPMHSKVQAAQNQQWNLSDENVGCAGVLSDAPVCRTIWNA